MDDSSINASLLGDHVEEGKEEAKLSAEEVRKAWCRRMPLMFFAIFQSYAATGTNSVVYMLGVQALGYNAAQATLFSSVYNAAYNLCGIPGGALSDWYIGRYKAQLWTSWVWFLGTLFLVAGALPWLARGSDEDVPIPRSGALPEESASELREGLVMAGMVIGSIAYGAQQPSQQAFIGDQMDSTGLGPRDLSRLFTYFYTADNVGALLGETVCPLLRHHVGLWACWTSVAIAQLLGVASLMMGVSGYSGMEFSVEKQGEEGMEGGRVGMVGKEEDDEKEESFADEASYLDDSGGGIGLDGGGYAHPTPSKPQPPQSTALFSPLLTSPSPAKLNPLSTPSTIATAETVTPPHHDGGKENGGVVLRSDPGSGTCLTLPPLPPPNSSDPEQDACAGSCCDPESRGCGARCCALCGYTNPEDAAGLRRVACVLAPLPVFWALYYQQGNTFITQANDMDLTLLSGTPDTIGAVNDAFVCVLVPLFDALIYPAINACGVKVTTLRRMAVGMVATALTFVAAALLQARIHHNAFHNLPKLSVAWMVPQLFLISVAETTVAVPGLEFAYAQATKRTRGVVQALGAIVQLGALLPGIAASLHISSLTDQFWFYAGLMALFTCIFIAIAHWFKPKKDSEMI